MTDGGGDLWLLLTVGGVVVLGAAMAFAIMRNRKMTSGQKKASESATRDVYAAEAREPENKDS